MKYLTLLFAFALFGCKNTGTLELEVLTKEVNALELGPSFNWPDYLKPDELAVDGSRTIVSYKLTNNTDTTYYFNVNGYEKILNNNYIKMDRAFVGITNSKGSLVKARGREPSRNYGYTDLLADYLDYNYYNKLDKKNFIIHPGETLYFEWFIVLPFGSFTEQAVYTVTLDSKEKYFAEVLLHSNCTDYAKEISRTDLKTIKENGYTVFNGTVKSKNKIPVVFNKEKP